MGMIQFAHISDIHLPATKEGPQGTCVIDQGKLNTPLKRMLEEGLDPQTNLDRCLQELEQESLDFVLVTGDCVHEGCEADYKRLRDQFDRRLPGVPVIVSAGNHDNRREFRRGFLGLDTEDDGPYYEKAVIPVPDSGLSPKWGLRILSLDSAWEKKSTGSLPREQLDALKKELQHRAGMGTILLFHNSILPMVGPLGFEQPEQLAEAIAGSDVAAIFNGHVHMSFTGTFCGALQVTGDSLNFGASLKHGQLIYNTRAAYNMCYLDEQGNYSVERRLLVPEAEVLASKPLSMI